ncbi:MAG TPA: hypothetical protein IAC20_02410 [Candidatus Faecisoma merdavium]|nr:hypothetical protein [Candidatus Faecisoma merdavium]
MNGNGSLDNYTVSNVTILGGYRGLNIHGVNNAIVENVKVSNASYASLAVASSNVEVSNCDFANVSSFFGGTIVVNYKENNNDYPIVSKVNIDDNNAIDGIIKIEGYKLGNDAIFANPDEWTLRKNIILGYYYSKN